MASRADPRTDPSDDKSGASPSAPGLTPTKPPQDRPVPGQEPEWGSPRNTPPDNPFDPVKTRSNE